METEQLYEQYQSLLFSIAYRMLGSVMDAEDIVQDTFVALREHPNPQDIDHMKAYLCKIVSFKCIDRIRREAKHREVYVGPWLPAPLAELEDEPSSAYLHKESLSTAYLLLLQQLSEVERIVFLLREAFQFEYAELAVIVGKSEANCRQIFHRAKRSITYEPERSVSAVQAGRSLVEQFLVALHKGDTQRLLELLAVDSVVFSDGGGKVNAALRPIVSASKVVSFLLGIAGKLPPATEFKLLHTGGSIGLATRVDGEVSSVLTFHVAGERIQQVYIVVNPDKLAHLNRPGIWDSM